MKRIAYFCSLVCLLTTGLLAQNDKTPEKSSYGMKPGTVSGTVGFGAVHFSGTNGLHPTVTGNVDISFQKYLAVFVDGAWAHDGNNASACVYGYCASARASAHSYEISTGLEVISRGRSRFVPYGRFGVGYASTNAHASLSSPLVSVSGKATYSAPALLFGGGVRYYLTHRWGFDTKLTALRTVGNNGGNTSLGPTFGVFFQSAK